MHTCLICGHVMKPLFTGWFCPQDCDRRPTSNTTDRLEWKPYPYKTGWRYAVVSRLEDLPERARGGWWIVKDSDPLNCQPYLDVDQIGWKYDASSIVDAKLQQKYLLNRLMVFDRD